MKRLLILLGTAALLGAGCWQSLPGEAPAATAPNGAPTGTAAGQHAAPTPTQPSGTKPTTTATKPKTTTAAPAQPSQPPSYVQFVSGQLQLSSSLSSYGVDLAWTKAATTSIKGYAVIRSQTDPNPYYPKEFYLHFINNYDTPTWRDTTLPHGQKAFYRICTIATDDSIACGNVVTVTRP